MAVLVGTHRGLYRCRDVPFDDAERVLDCGTVNRVHARGGDLLAATDEGLYRSTDGREWTALPVPRSPVVSVTTTPDGERLFAGTRPAAVYASDDGGDSWRELTGFRDVPAHEHWRGHTFRDDAHVRTLAVHPDAPDRVAAGVEPGGVVVSEDRGATWEPRNRGVHEDVHHLLTSAAGEYVAACGNGLYRSTDAGRTWLRLDTTFQEFWYNYFRESRRHEGTLFAAATGWGPAQPGGVVLRRRDRSFVREPYPGSDDRFVLSWAAADGSLLAGTMRVGAEEGFLGSKPATVLQRADGEWTVAGEVPAGVRSLVAV